MFADSNPTLPVDVGSKFLVLRYNAATPRNSTVSITTYILTPEIPVAVPVVESFGSTTSEVFLNHIDKILKYRVIIVIDDTSLHSHLDKLFCFRPECKTSYSYKTKIIS